MSHGGSQMDLTRQCVTPSALAEPMDGLPPPFPKLWYRSWRQCRITGFISVPARPGARHGGHCVDLAHLYPRRLCSPERARDPDNLVAMINWIHRLFDGALVSFDSRGRLIFDQRLPYDLQKRLVGLSISEYTPRNDSYMARHRQWVAKQGFAPKRTLPL